MQQYLSISPGVEQVVYSGFISTFSHKKTAAVAANPPNESRS